ncbi:flagellar biosynthetic protein FliO [Actinotalea sp. BY-33]|uniref:Flagellar protein n=1 Tax=Actinotalea soli TaxID=2819234 RepID=A0A939LP72_9CELL|nr:flagellar biosynthetic protein FliO [Actinotalea soli]MBO1751273.1 flagellar biosynthetic protein FliO [Actinotalea soli]
MDTSSLMLGLRVLLSLAVVLGLLWFLARRLSGTKAVRRRATDLAVIGKQSLGGKTGLALVEVGGRRLLLGVSEQGVNLLTEVDMPVEPPAPVALVLSEDDEPAEAGTGLGHERTPLDPAAIERLVAEVPSDVSSLTPHATDGVELSPSTPAARMPAVPKQRSPLEGSILDATLWRRAMVAVQERTIRR